MTHARFHLAFPVTDIEATRRFYTQQLGCSVGREAERWIDFDFHGNQISAHLVDELDEAARNAVDGKSVPTRHFGLIIEWDEWEALAERLRGAGVEFLIEPYVRFEGEPGEQGTFFVFDPSGNALEFKTFRDMDDIFAT
ncbi:MAG: VOC family protein [Gammaproteobacteria bacterium]|nr:VOC family protein [Gammaproteobacteria bacterium]